MGSNLKERVEEVRQELKPHFAMFLTDPPRANYAIKAADLITAMEARIEELELLNYAFEEGSAEWESDYKSCKCKLDRAAKALEYYANGGDWVGGEVDRGDVAKQALTVKDDSNES